ncbi:alpha/beta hydrolase [Actinocorallia sp. API 0066]|uniref:alpha/beta hydrolase n=1 Tax=Actinocorallia sp. API 0066 TaxID=2896846 RepID=UPI001E35FDA2|nr:alpha/beta hydrolase [Actinocorallia sp. API 0066]MCD0447773.1 alpha/beta hydrolase [Actinocorallia sp. API 0066]
MTQTPPPFDLELGATLAALAGVVSPTITPEDIPTLRGARTMTLPDLDLTLGGRLTVEEVTAPGPRGPIPLIVGRPVEAGRPLPALYYMHGGGMIAGDARGGVLGPLKWAAELGLVVVSVDYRLAPEHPHPAPVEDCYAGLVWTVEQADVLGVDPHAVVVSGTSAGGGLAAAVALMARDRGGPPLLGQLLMCPMLDDRNSSGSALQMDGLGVWDRTSNATGWTALLGEAAGGPDVSPYAAPARATDLSNLPPAFIDVGSAETFRDEDVAYAAGIWASGGSAELHVWPGGFHGFDLLAPKAALSREARAARLAWLRRLLPWPDGEGRFG